MEKIKQEFEHDYNLAINFYNNGDIVSFLRNLRPAIENFCRIVVYDLLGQEVAKEVLAGKKKITVDFKKCSAIMKDEPTAKRVENSALAVVAQYAIYFKKGDKLSKSSDDRIWSRIKSNIDSDFIKLKSAHSSCSEAASHTGESRVDNETEAQDLATFMPKVFSDVKNFVSENLRNFLETLDKTNTMVSFQDPKSEQLLNRDNDFLVFDDRTNKMMRNSDFNYVIFLPEETNCAYKSISREVCAYFFAIPWKLVVDLDPKTSNGLYEKAPSDIQKTSIRIISNEANEISGTSNMINWLFGKGREDIEVFDSKRILRDTPKLFLDTFKKLIRTGKTNDCIIIDFCDCNHKLSDRLYNRLEDVFGNLQTVASRCTIFAFNKDEDYKDKKKEWAEDLGINSVYFVSASFCDFLNHLKELNLSAIVSSQSQLYVLNNKLNLTEDKERYKEAGIEFFAPSTVRNEKKQLEWDFYAGAEITWEELDKQSDVSREIYDKLNDRILQIIRTMRKVQFFTLRHRPGSGATTLAHRLAFDIYKLSQKELVSCIVVEIKNGSNIRLTEQYLCKLSEIADNAAILALVESKNVGKDKLDTLVKRISDAGKKVLFFYIEPYTGEFNNKQENVVFLDSIITKNEMPRFEDKYLSLGLQESLLNEVNIGVRKIEVVDFPLMLKDKETSANLSTYVSEWMDALPENLRKFCAFVGFVFKYSDKGVNQTILKSLWKDAKHATLYAYRKEFTAISKLLIEEMANDGKSTGIWRPRYNRFSDFILNAYKVNWMSAIPEFAKEFIAFCKEMGELGSDDKDMLYSIFVIRKNADYRAIEDKNNDIRNKFSLLVSDLKDDVERAESLFQSLVNAFPEDAIFRGHFARFLYEKASMLNADVDDRLFDDAQTELDKAFELNEEDADLYHMKGMLLRRKLFALLKKVKSNKMNPEESLDKNFECDLEDWTQEAYQAFEQSISLSPASPYGYAAECQLFKESICLGKELLCCKDFSFCETNILFANYTEKLGDVLDLFEQICYAFKDDGISIISNAYKIYQSVRLFHQNIIGKDVESIQRYRKMYNKATHEQKDFYGNLLIKSIVYSQTSSLNTRRVYSNLLMDERNEIAEILKCQINQGNIKSYEKLFLLKLCSPEDYSLDDAIDFLKDWECQFDYNNQTGWGYLNACFYLAVSYSAKAIFSEERNIEMSQLAKKYFHKTEELAKQFEKGTVRPLCYLGEKKDIHCILDKDKKNDAYLVSGVISNIKNQKGIMKMKCGVEATFNANKLDPLRDEGHKLRGIIGFAYSGPGLYEFNKEEDYNATQERYDELIDEQKTFEELEKEDLQPEDLVEEKKEAIENEPNCSFGVKTVGYLDFSKVTSFDEKNKNRSSVKKYHGTNINGKSGIFEDGKFEGVIVKNKGHMMIDTPVYPYWLRIEKSKDEFYEDEKVIFTAKSKPNEKNPIAKVWYAINVKLKEDE